MKTPNIILLSILSLFLATASVAQAQYDSPPVKKHSPKHSAKKKKAKTKKSAKHSSHPGKKVAHGKAAKGKKRQVASQKGKHKKSRSASSGNSNY